MGTTNLPKPSSRARLRSKRVKPMVVLTDCVPEPLRSSSNAPSSGWGMAWFSVVRRLGIDPPSRRRRSIMYWYSTESSEGRK